LSRTYDVLINGNALQLGLVLKYEYPKGKWRPTLAAGGAVIYMPDGSITELRDASLTGIAEMKIDIKRMLGFGIIPGVHYYFAKDRIIFLQMQYLHLFKEVLAYTEGDDVGIVWPRSFGLSAGIYF
jgi:hypothetical protein